MGKRLGYAALALGVVLVLLGAGWIVIAMTYFPLFDCGYEERGRRLALSDGLEAVQLEVNCGATTSTAYWVVVGRDLNEETYRDNLVVSLDAPVRIGFEDGRLYVHRQKTLSALDDIHGIEVQYIRGGE